MASSSPLLFQLTKDINMIQATLITNIVKMMIDRGWMNKQKIDRNNVKEFVERILKTESEDETFKIKIDEDDNLLVVKLLPQKISGKNPIISTFMNTYLNNYKILVLDSIVDNTRENLLKQAPNLEIFNESYFMMNILDHVYSPTYIKLDQEEIKNVLESYKLTKNAMKKMYDTDPVSTYLKVKKGDMVRIIRNSEQTCKSVDYRVVITQGNIHNYE